MTESTVNEPSINEPSINEPSTNKLGTTMNSGVLGHLPFGVWHVKFLLIMAVAWAFDAMDTGIIAFVLPKLMKVWSLSPGQIGIIGSMGLVGMAIGAVLAGTLADKFGRKRVMIGMMVVYGLASLGCAESTSFEMLLLFRIIVGFGLGGQLPVAVTLISEYAPISHRGRMIVWVESSWAVGWLVAAIMAYFVIPDYGWEPAFYVGALPVLWAIVVAFTIPESAQYLEKQGNYDAARNIVGHIVHDAGTAGTVAVEAAKSAVVAINSDASDTTKSVKAFTVATLFSKPYLQRTLCLWIVWFGLVFSYYGIFMWLPTLLVKSGHTMIQSFSFVLWMTIAQIPGYAVAAYLIDCIGRKKTLSSFLLLCAVSAYFFGHATSSTEILVYGCAMSFFNLGAWGCIYTYTPEMYPTEGRATGSGWAAACGRCGGIVAPLVVGALFTGPDQFALIFGIFTGVLVIISLTLWFLGVETMNKDLDYI